MRKTIATGLISFLTFFFIACIVEAEPLHGIAMHGIPKYKDNFSHLDYANNEAPKGGELRLGVTGSFDSLNPFIIKGRSAAGRHYVFESLLARVWDEPFTLYGLIAETVEVPEDRSWVSFALRPEARFHDGSFITIDDVIFSWRTLRDHGRANMRLFYGKVERAERVGSGGVRFIFKPDQLDRELPLLMGLMPIISKTYYKDRVFEETTLDPPMGSGPYKVLKVDPGRRVIYERVKDYWGASLPVRIGHNNFDRVSYEYFRDASILMEAFKGGVYDLRREWSASRWNSNYKFPAVKNGEVVLEEIGNQRPAGMKAFVFNTRRKIFADIRVREAINYAFDFDWINSSLLHGAYKRTESFFANSDLASYGLPSSDELLLLQPMRSEIPENVFLRAYRAPSSQGQGGIRRSLRKAQALLDKAGWTIENGERVRIADGERLNFEILLVNPDNERIALVFARNLKKLGIEARVRTVDSSQYQSRRQTYDYDMIVHRWRVTLSPGNEQAFYWGSSAADTEGTRNYIGLRSAAVDKLINYITNTTDRKKLVTGMRSLDRILLHGHYVVPMYHIDRDRVAYWNRLSRPRNTPIYGFVLETWWQDSTKAKALPRQ